MCLNISAKEISKKSKQVCLMAASAEQPLERSQKSPPSGNKES